MGQRKLPGWAVNPGGGELSRWVRIERVPALVGRHPWQEPSGQPELPRPAAWTVRAACQGLATPDFDPWHPDAPCYGGDPLLMYAVARRVCRRCPVRLECALQGLDLLASTEGGVRGMWDGLTPPELRKLARDLAKPSRKVAQHGTRAKYVAGCRCRPCVRVNSVMEHQRRLAKQYEDESPRWWAGPPQLGPPLPVAV